MSRILIIEDETPMRTALKDVMEAEGYRTITAADGESGCIANRIEHRCRSGVHQPCASS